MICLWCGDENPERARFCGDCGRTLQFDLVCGACGAANPRVHGFCDTCGAALADEALPELAVGPAAHPQETAAPADEAPAASAAAARGPRSWPRIGWLPKPGLQWEMPAPRVELTWEYLRSWVLRHRLELLVVAVVTGISALLRIYRLADIPAGLTGDEALTGIDALRVLEEGWIGPYVGSALGQPTGPLYFTGLVFKVSHASLFTLRLSMSLLGVATVPAAYVLFRLGFGRWVALVAMVALAFSYWHLHYSRIAFMLISMPLVTTLTAVALLSALRSARRWPWVVAGLLLGVGVYSYNGYVVFLAAVAAFLAVVLLLSRLEWRRHLTSFALMGAAAVLIALPMIRLALFSPEFYFQHHRLTSLLKAPGFSSAETVGERIDYLAGRAWDAATLLYTHSEIDFSDAMGERGALDPFLALLAYAGLVIALVRWRNPPHLLLAIVVIFGLGSVILGGETWGELRRSLVTVPFVYGLAGVAAIEIVRAGRRVFGRFGHRLAAAGAAVVVVAAISWNGWYYFGELAQQEYVDWVFVSDLVAGLDAAHVFGDPGRIYFYAPRWGYDYETRLFLYPDSPGIDRSREFGEFSLDRLDAGPVTYLLFPPYASEVEALREMFPDGLAVEEFNDRGGRVFSVYHLP